MRRDDMHKFAGLPSVLISLTVISIRIWAAEPVSNLPGDSSSPVKQFVGQNAPPPASAPVMLLPQTGSAPVRQDGFPLESAPPRPNYFTPYMLGDFVGPLANLFSEVKIAEGES